MNSAYIIDAVRTPIGRYGGSLSTIRPDDMAALVLSRLISRNHNIDPIDIDDVILGCANQSGEDNRNVARMALLLAGLPHTIPGETVNRLCASGMSAVINAARAIMTDDFNLAIAGGVESMTRAPFVMPKAATPFGRNAEIYDTTLGWRFVNSNLKDKYGTDSMGETAENVAENYYISREDQDRFALNSQLKACMADRKGRLLKEITHVELKHKNQPTAFFEHDEFIKPETTYEILSSLKPAFKQGGTVTAGNSSGLNDGAAAMLLASEDAVTRYKLEPKARIVASAVTGVEPRLMGLGPVEASNMALAKAKLQFDDMDVIELNEAFAAQCLACLRLWGLNDDDPRVNPNGGAIALGHPLGMSGTRLLTTAMYELHERKGRYALCTMCVGVGQGYAVILEKI